MKISYIDLVKNLSENLQKNNQLEKVLIQFRKDYNLVPAIGVEIEFYLSHNTDISQFEVLANKYLAIYKISGIKKEKGCNQFEVDLPPSQNLIQYIDKIFKVKDILAEVATQSGGYIDFSPKPFLNDYGNSMHFHISFNSESDYYVNTAARGLCHYMLDTLLVFMPSENDYLRIDKNFMAPTHVAFGGNNRTVAVRVPDSHPRRLEYRLASPNTDPYIAIFAILKSIFLAFELPNEHNHINKIYGNAFDAQYNLTPIPRSLDESFKLFKPEFFI